MLGWFKKPDVDTLAAKRDVQGLLKLLKPHVNWSIRMKAARALGELGDVQAVEPLIAVMREGVSQLGWEAAKSLGKLGDARAVDPLLHFLTTAEEPRFHDGSSQHESRISAALEALKALDAHLTDAQRVTVALYTNSFEVRKAALDKYGAVATGPLAEALNAKVARVRENALQGIRLVGEVHMVGPLIAALKSPDDKVRRGAAELLGRAGDVRAVEPLIAALKDDDSHVRGAAAEALGELDDARAVEPLMDMLNAEYLDERLAAALAMGKLRDVDSFVDLLEKGDRDVSIAVAAAIAQHGDVRGFDYLISAAENSGTRERAEPIVTSLLVLFRRFADKFPTEKLREIAALKIVEKEYYSLGSNSVGQEEFVTYKDEIYDTSYLQKLAREELARREDQV